MNFQKNTDNGFTLISVKLKRATLAESDEFKNILNEEVENGTMHLIVEMSEIEYIDSTFLGVLVTTLKKVSAKGGDILLVGFKSTAQSVIDITGTSRIFKIYPSVKQAVSSIQSAA